MFLSDGATSGHLDCSEATSRLVDEEVKQLLDSAYRAAKQILTDHREQLENVTRELLIKETLDAATFNSLITNS
ncbi:MAG: hypothetical protein KDB27_34710 [Planctomycetales bacterium]|nr:hypothetical protein [Planctomycetales bacterium]